MNYNDKKPNHIPTFARTIVRNVSGTGRGRKQAISMLFDALAVLFSLWAAYALRYSSLDVDVVHLGLHAAILTSMTVLVFSGLGIYRWVVRSSNLGLLIQIVKASVVSAVLLLILQFLIPTDSVNPRSVFVIYGLVLGITCCGLRGLWKGLFDSGNRGAPVAIFGAGSAGTQLAEIMKNGQRCCPVCFIDDNPALVGSTVAGSPVLNGSSDELKSELAKREVTEVIIAIPSLASVEYGDIYNRVEKLGLPFKTGPSIVELLSGAASINEIRDVSVSDILGRNEVLPDPALLDAAVRGKSILVTGGGGSIGSELCRQIVRLNPVKLIVLDNSEANLYHISEEISQLIKDNPAYQAVAFEAMLCSVTDRNRVERAFSIHQFDSVYHAAAYKHVPIVENHPEQGVEVNVFGTLNVLDAAIRTGVERFVFISTDKAVRPANAMGASKRVAELVLQAKSRRSSGTTISMVRFGNVLASNGSVVPKFRKQIQEGGPVTLTDPDITRYFMTIPEASQLVIQASAISKSGDVFVLDMGEPIKISHLAETMIRLHGQQVEQAGGRRPDIKIEITGLRPGEKMYEELFVDDTCEQTAVLKVFSANEKHIPWEMLKPQLNQLRAALTESEPDVVKTRLFAIVTGVDRRGSAFGKIVVSDVECTNSAEAVSI